MSGMTYTGFIAFLPKMLVIVNGNWQYGRFSWICSSKHVLFVVGFHHFDLPSIASIAGVDVRVSSVHEVVVKNNDCFFIIRHTEIRQNIYAHRRGVWWWKNFWSGLNIPSKELESNDKYENLKLVNGRSHEHKIAVSVLCFTQNIDYFSVVQCTYDSKPLFGH